MITQQSDCLALLVGMTEPNQAMFESEKPLELGSYVVFELNGKRVAAFVEKSFMSSIAFSNGRTRPYQELWEIKRAADGNNRDKQHHGLLRIIGYLESLKNGEDEKPSIPPTPGTRVLQASDEELRIICHPGNPESLDIGTVLRNPKIKAQVNGTILGTEHWVVLAKTGSGKTNTTSQVVKQFANIKATIVIFDFANEYSALELGDRKNIVPARMRPQSMRIRHLADLMGIYESNARNQYYCFVDAFDARARQATSEDEFIAILNKNIDSQKSSNKNDPKKVKNIVKRKLRELSALFDYKSSDEAIWKIQNRKINIINMKPLTVEHADILIADYLEKMYEDRSKAQEAIDNGHPDPVRHFRYPVVAIIEEASNFIPNSDKLETWTKPIAIRVAQEGRKSGLSLGIVSQRPRGLNQTVLAQMGTYFIMQMTQPEDLESIRSFADALSPEIIDQVIPSFNKGQCVIGGKGVRTSSFVQVTKVEERRFGSDINAYKMWSEGHDDADPVRHSTQGLKNDITEIKENVLSVSKIINNLELSDTYQDQKYIIDASPDEDIWK